MRNVSKWQEFLWLAHGCAWPLDHREMLRVKMSGSCEVISAAVNVRMFTGTVLRWDDGVHLG